MMIKRIARSILIVLCLCVAKDVSPLQRVVAVPVTWTEEENEIAGRIAALFDAALDCDYITKTPRIGAAIDEAIAVFPPYEDIDDAGRGVVLSLEQYPQTLVGVEYESLTPLEAIEKFLIAANAGDQHKRLRDGSQPLRFQSHACSNAKPLCPFLIKVKIIGWPELESLRFLHHPVLEEIVLFRKCLSDFQVSSCGLTKLDGRCFRGYPNLVHLDLHDNLIADFVLNGDEGVGLGTLESLDLSNNNISNLRAVFSSGWSRLQDLNLSKNVISGLSNETFNGLILLYRLNLSSNLLISGHIDENAFEGVGKAAPFFNLNIDLSDNVLTTFPPLQPVAQKLVHLVLDQNPIMQVDGNEVHFGGMKLLRRISLVYASRTDAQNIQLAVQLTALLPGCRVIAKDQGVNDGYRTP